MAERGLRVRLEAETGAFAARMAAAENQLLRMERAPVAAARGIGMLRTSMQQLAFEVTGATGPLGRAVGAIGMLGVGSTAVLAFTGGVGAMVLLLKDFRAGAEEAGKAADAAEKRITALLAKMIPAAAAMAERQAKGAELAAARDALSLTVAKQFAAQQVGLPISAAKFANEAAQQQRLVNELAQEYTLLVDKSKKATQGVVDEGLKKQSAELDLINQAMLLQLELANDIKEVFESIKPVDISQFLLVPAQWEIALQRGRFGAGAFQGPAHTGFGMARFQRPDDFRFGASFNVRALEEPTKQLESLERALEMAGVGAGQMEAMVVTAFGTMVSSVIADTDRMGAVVVSGFFQMASQVIATERAMAIQRATIAAAGAVGDAGTKAAAGAAAGGALAGPWGAVAVAGVAIVGGIIGSILGKHRTETRPIPVRDDANRAAVENLTKRIEELERRRPIQRSIIIYNGRGNPRDFLAQVDREVSLGGWPAMEGGFNR